MSAGPVACFGEVLLRLTPPGKVPLAQTGGLEVHAGGAEANVAAALASLGRPARIVSVLPDNPLGRLARSRLASAGVDTRAIATGEGRMGLYFFEPPAGPIAGRVTYDRAHSAFAFTAPDRLDFAAALDGAALLHMSGITPALGPAGVELARTAVAAAQKNGVPICFDGNYRASLWDAWAGNPRAILGELVAAAKVLIGNHRDISLLLDKRFGGEGPERRREAAEAAFDTFPNLELIASTARRVAGTVHHLAARVDSRDGHCQTDEVRIDGIVDRIGTGDAFAAGLLLRYLEGADPAEMARSALALAAMKHGIPGDMIAATRAELEQFDPAGGDVRR